MSDKDQKQWYVIRAIGGKEKKVKEYIETEVHNSHLEDYISQVLLPTEKVYQIKNGKKISRERVSYPGYVLVEAALKGLLPEGMLDRVLAACTATANRDDYRGIGLYKLIWRGNRSPRPWSMPMTIGASPSWPGGWGATRSTTSSFCGRRTT